jgi:hypothetical protein
MVILTAKGKIHRTNSLQQPDMPTMEGRGKGDSMATETPFLH